MKKKIISIFLVIALLLAAMPLVIMTNITVEAANPYLPLWERIPDGEPRVFDDPDNPGKQRVYIYGSQDALDPTSYCGYRHAAWSAPLEDLNAWRYDGISFDRDWLNGVLDENGQPFVVDPRDALYAPDCVYNPVTKKYYQYVFTARVSAPGMPNGDMTARTWVGVSSTPDGPFNEEIYFVDAGWHTQAAVGLPAGGSTQEQVGHAFSSQSFVSGDASRGGMPSDITGSGGTDGVHRGAFDPGVYVEVTETDAQGNPTDFKAYIYWGFSRMYNAELNQDMKTIKRDTIRVNDAIIPVSGHGYFEASSMRKMGSHYVFIYSGPSSRLSYAIGQNPLGPFTYRGYFVDNAGETVPNPYSTGNARTWKGSNNHGSVAEINGRWYIFGHRHTGEPGGYPTAAKRQAFVEPIPNLVITEDTITAGIAEMTSNGFELNGLNPYKEQDAAITCYQVPPSNNNAYIDARNFDEEAWTDKTVFQRMEGMDWNPVIIRNNNVKMGYKYFNFGQGVSAGSNLSLVLTMKETALANGRTVNVYASGGVAKSGDPIPEQFLIGSTVLTGKTDLHAVEIPITQNLDKLTEKTGIFIEFLASGSTSTATVCEYNKIQFEIVPEYTILAGEQITLPIKVKNCENFAGLTGLVHYDEALWQFDGFSSVAGFILTNKFDRFASIKLDGLNVAGGEAVIGKILLTAKKNLTGDALTTVSFDVLGAAGEDQADESVRIQSMRVNILMPTIPGDVNLDGKVNLKDAILLLQYLSKETTLSARQLRAADVLADGQVNTADVVIIMQMSLEE